MSIISKAVCRFIVILSNSNGISYRNTKNNSKNPHVITKRPQIPKEVPRRMKNAEHIKIWFQIILQSYQKNIVLT